ncbi:MAG: hypothetical protein ACD_81C00186G0001 [uncultured bacterium]|uniref:Uncharacterized protein n=2 Tax=Candidatus Wolfeibacteriota TaxID=1752735 RepID=A0A0G1K7C1_9BACT|nr:MAG: hypothetical protein ACD_81C00186G0001 [uncultured bacterium]KKR12823.1 MAG: hypothetical protein UT41_C0001G0367 [Candidatus Wolfebacteria bacterium GW2011_GWC2_39_22]KKT43754.1 MAG: hypothetical protein UW32_C0001G0346 [Candidatus Wolfebacteria bacterium GW2011_GWE2_44_13]HBI25515.1 hypothetical protein [Candidatus Wolfebacteria bacterium]
MLFAKYRKELLAIASILLLVGIGIFIWAQFFAAVPCTQEARVCPDGRIVGRTEPNCTFSSCHQVLQSSGFGNKQLEQAITNYLVTQNRFSWKTQPGSFSLCVVENLEPQNELFPLAVWAYCGEYTLQEGILKTLSGSSGPVAINYPNELSFYDSNKFSYEAPGDGAQYSEDIKRIFSQPVQEAILNGSRDGLIDRAKAEAFDTVMRWNRIVEATMNCEVAEIFQAHSLFVSATLKNGDKLTAVEPTIDDIMDVANAASAQCGRIIMATE